MLGRNSGLGRIDEGAGEAYRVVVAGHNAKPLAEALNGLHADGYDALAVLPPQGGFTTIVARLRAAA